MSPDVPSEVAEEEGDIGVSSGFWRLITSNIVSSVDRSVDLASFTTGLVETVATVSFGDSIVVLLK